jgi:asparagine synthase (glutamine-hydrolysing)
VDALAALLDEVRAAGRIDENALRGNFALFIHAGDHVWLLNDALGFVRIYASADGCFFSTSWLAACAYLERVELDEASAIEYVLTGAAHSRDSVARNVTLLKLGWAHDLTRRCMWQRFPSGIAAGGHAFSSLDEAVEAVAAHLHEVFDEVATAFPGRIRAALSGGFDSRLIVAGLRACGAHPELFVYGRAESPDVVVAKAVARSAELALDVIDKDIVNRDLPPPDVASLEQSALFFDGLPNDGLHDRGADQQTRLQQNADGYIALNGGGGEIFRNFFHLADRSFTADDIVETFYRGFSTKVFRGAHGLSDYKARLAASVVETLAIPDSGGNRLTRRQVELVYPLFRCHFWMGVNNSVGVRHGYYATPLVDLGLVRIAQRLPLRWKNAGAFQSRLVAALHPGVAAQPSAYGFRFNDGPGWKHRLAERLACARPPKLRPLINAARRRLYNVQVAPDSLQRYRELLPGEWRLDPLLDLRHLPDDTALRRAFAVEVVWRRIFQ